MQEYLGAVLVMSLQLLRQPYDFYDECLLIYFFVHIYFNGFGDRFDPTILSTFYYLIFTVRPFNIPK